MDILSLLAQPIIHSQGHNVRGTELDVPTHVNYAKAVENWQEPKDWRKATEMHGAGFKAQDLFAEALQDPEFRKAVGFYKLTYPLGLKLFGAKTSNNMGDIGGVASRSGNKFYAAMLGIDALSDLLFDTNKQKIDARIENGIPALLYSRKF